MKKLLSILLLLVGVFTQIPSSIAQTTWSRAIAGISTNQFGSGVNNGLDILESRSGGYIAAGIQDLVTGAPREYPFLCKLDAIGNTIWKRNYFAGDTIANIYAVRDISVVETSVGDLLVAATNSHLNGGRGVLLMKTNNVGDTIWTQHNFLSSTFTSFPTTSIVSRTRIDKTMDGNYMLFVSGNFNVGAPGPDDFTILTKIDANGGILWQKVLRTITTNRVIATHSNGYVLVGHQANVASIYKLDAMGDSIWQTTMQPPFEFKGVVQLPDSSFVVGMQDFSLMANHPALGFIDKQGVFGSPVIISGIQEGEISELRYDTNGYVIGTGFTKIYHPAGPVGVTSTRATIIKYNINTGSVQQTISPSPSFASYISKGLDIELTQDGVYVMVGQYINKLYVVKTDPNRIIASIPQHTFRGNVYVDRNYDCSRDSVEQGMAGWLVEAEANGVHYYATTNTNGDYTIYATDTGTFTLKALAPNHLWQSCPDSVVLTSSTLSNTDTVHFGAQALVNCPLMEVDISTPFLRRCSTNTYYVNYCNDGTVDATGVYVTVELDSFLTVIGASLPYTTAGNVYTFQLDTVEWSTCGSFTIQTMVSCSAILGQVHCVDARIYPDSSCIVPSLLWDGSDIQVRSTIMGSDVEFVVKNVGSGNMNAMRQYFVTEDHVMLLTRPYQLNSGDSIIERIQTIGATYRLAAEQDPNHPINTFSAATATRFTFLTTSGANPGNLLQYPDADESPAVSIDCQANRGSFDPNDKQAFPIGYGISHAIEAETDIEYMIRFQNTGTDTAFKVVVVDTLSPFLDKTSIQMGASSHSYTWELVDTGTLRVIFDNILLVDSTTNEPLSHGFFKFKISQKAANPLGTIIENEAGIFFDWNAPIWTNTVFHTIDANFIIDNVRKISNDDNLQINVFPNPMHTTATLEIEGTSFNQLEVILVDAMGRVVQQQQVIGSEQIMLHREGLNTGIYFFRLSGDGELIGTGKVLVK